MSNNDEENWLEGAFLAQEEYDRDRDKWKGRRKDMESHFLSQYDTVPDTSPRPRSSGSPHETTVLIGALVVGIISLCVFLVTAISG